MPIVVPVSGRKLVAAADDDIELNTAGHKNLSLEIVVSRWP